MVAAARGSRKTHGAEWQRAILPATLHSIEGIDGAEGGRRAFSMARMIRW